MRMGFVEVKVAIVKLLAKFNFERVNNNPIEFDTFAMSLQPKDGLPLKVTLRKK